MGKRSSGSFERRAGDFYAVAVLPLIPWLRGVRTFAEPCAGAGDLVRHLESFGFKCVYQGDISTGQDALAIAGYGVIDAIITNPPYTLDVMHALIAHFRLGVDETGSAVHGFVHGHYSDRPRQVDLARSSRQGQFRLVPVRRRAYQRACLSSARTDRHHDATDPRLPAMRCALSSRS
jgi:hypothetical protein